ncbi:TfoX/Sxy family protein [Nigerium massiliense]|uniref:TfoX/Sxy family protein n=1 Tax=Nigerium massiliense TaxID=1522317 RepID=UPI000590643B|nr:TfoX/Sxy family protein [Nigerium massiliense]
MTPEQTTTLDRLRALLTQDAGVRDVREVSMFGGRSVMVNGKMIVSVRKDGGLLLRVDASRHDELLDEPGANPATMGRDRRDMGPGWIEIEPAAISDDTDLARWIALALEYNRVVTGGTAEPDPGAGSR